MSEVVYIYCDESCHLENDGMKAMALGALWCPADERKSLSRKIKEIKAEYGMPPGFEIKWVKISPGKLSFYQAILDLFFDEAMLHFRGLVVPDKQLLDHGRFAQSHDDFYYKQWYTLLNRLINRDNRYRIFLDIKDTRGRRKVAKLHEVLCNANYDFDRGIIESIEQVQSHDVPLLQLTDLLIGALTYVHRGLQGNSAKQALIEQMQRRSGLSLKQSSAWQAEKFNLLVWRAQP
ncbi:DUF3800 domain-containing protein [Acidithiobacillus caldus]|jgi:hypothetical protein|uniref:DUF3800 domain-containing protein n=1 Tax=Acidithiobacillus caldus TaxID=33059 RepID=UPI001C06B8E5|nr:DUF3800 domain-containing protein [Acidithiobacillus caldus]MBU2783476.1 DUF3800 domain-containing protein [Acidithiobacillus caldus]